MWCLCGFSIIFTRSRLFFYFLLDFLTQSEHFTLDGFWVKNVPLGVERLCSLGVSGRLCSRSLISDLYNRHFTNSFPFLYLLFENKSFGSPKLQRASVKKCRVQCHRPRSIFF
ncbi:hypothetical protein, unlikely [Trypanosoma brucei brucei TREU927]|uniref:Secreted protein n=1 Tax=Trypanosoma brucei brucei (strain 927/4 GUTat10.1) TaxID=185431 RepID=Q38CP9_TRYB2|nr:hypothetical protein, unlikely [Trypanosoma brucei brucei TREU927]EAN77421.1 hypothetical protein, unlikely [Trypanosoma brucei brucei TREU927]